MSLPMTVQGEAIQGMAVDGESFDVLGSLVQGQGTGEWDVAREWKPTFQAAEPEEETEAGISAALALSEEQEKRLGRLAARAHTASREAVAHCGTLRTRLAAAIQQEEERREAARVEEQSRAEREAAEGKAAVHTPGARPPSLSQMLDMVSEKLGVERSLPAVAAAAKHQLGLDTPPSAKGANLALASMAFAMLTGSDAGSASGSGSV